MDPKMAGENAPKPQVNKKEMKDKVNTEPPSGTTQSKKRKVPVDDDDENNSITVASPEPTGIKPSASASPAEQSTSSAPADAITVKTSKTKGPRSKPTAPTKNKTSTTNNLVADGTAPEMAEKTSEPKTPNKRAKKTAKATDADPMQGDMNSDPKALGLTTPNRATTPAQTGGKGEGTKKARSTKSFTPSKNQSQVPIPVAQMQAPSSAMETLVAQTKKQLEQISSEEERIQTSRTKILTALGSGIADLETAENFLSARRANARLEISKLSTLAERLKEELAKAKDDLSMALSVEKEISKECEEFSKAKIEGPQMLEALDKELKVKKEEKEKLMGLMVFLGDAQIEKMLAGKENGL